MDYSQYLEAVNSLKNVHIQYEQINKTAENYLKKPAANNNVVKTNQLISKLNQLNLKQEESINTINDYYNEGFGKVVWFFSSSSNESDIAAATNSQKNTTKKLMDLSYIVRSAQSSKTETKKTPSEDQIALHDEIGTKLNGIDKIIIDINPNVERKNIEKAESLYTEIQKLTNKITNTEDQIEAKQESIKGAGNNTKNLSVDDIYANPTPTNTVLEEIVELDTILKNLYNERRKKASEMDKISPQINSLVASSNELMKEIKEQLEPYGHNDNIALPKELSDDLNAIQSGSTPTELKNALRKAYIDKKATYEKTRRTDPHFNFLVLAYEALDYRMKHKKIGFSDAFNRSEMETKELDQLAAKKTAPTPEATN